MIADNLSPKPGKCDILESILIGNQQTNKLNSKDFKNRKPENIINKLLRFISNTSDKHASEQAVLAIDILRNNTSDSPLTETEGRKIYDQVTK